MKNKISAKMMFWETIKSASSNVKFEMVEKLIKISETKTDES